MRLSLSYVAHCRRAAHHPRAIRRTLSPRALARRLVSPPRAGSPSTALRNAGPWRPRGPSLTTSRIYDEQVGCNMLIAYTLEKRDKCPLNINKVIKVEEANSRLCCCAFKHRLVEPIIRVGRRRREPVVVLAALFLAAAAAARHAARPVAGHRLGRIAALFVSKIRWKKRDRTRGCRDRRRPPSSCS